MQIGSGSHSYESQPSCYSISVTEQELNKNQTQEAQALCINTQEIWSMEGNMSTPNIGNTVSLPACLSLLFEFSSHTAILLSSCTVKGTLLYKDQHSTLDYCRFCALKHKSHTTLWKPELQTERKKPTPKLTSQTAIHDHLSPSAAAALAARGLLNSHLSSCPKFTTSLCHTLQDSNQMLTFSQACLTDLKTKAYSLWD